MPDNPADQDPNHPAAPAPPVLPEEQPVESTAQSAAAYDRWIAKARALPAAEVADWRGSPSLLRANAKLAGAAVVAEKAAIAAQMPYLDWQAIESFGDLGEAVYEAFVRADRTANAVALPYEAHHAQVGKDRKKVMALLQLLVAEDQIGQAEYSAIAAGTGARDAAEDVVAGYALLGNCAAAAGKFEPAVAAAAVTRANAFLDRLRPATRKGGYAKAGAEAEAADVRDRMFTLALRAYEAVFKAAACRWGTKWSDHVPALAQRRL